MTGALAAPGGRSRTTAGLSAVSFEAVLSLLDDDRDRAGERYEALRRKLVKFFECRGCAEPDRLADATIDRVGRRLADGDRVRTGDAGAYFHGVARNVLRESWREGHRSYPRELPSKAGGTDELAELRLRCLDACLDALRAEERQLILWYYQAGERVHIESRKGLAGALGIGMNALRVRVHRIRVRLESCVRMRLVALAEMDSSPGARRSEEEVAR